ncbi:hypothetical protein QJS66_12460 [Kocuria rhizophila]|nr:hypothetical protein QJS66_12460 [Kocuria rhizophila]
MPGAGRLVVEVATAIHGGPSRRTATAGEERIPLTRGQRSVHRRLQAGALLAGGGSRRRDHGVHWSEEMTSGEVVLELYDELVDDHPAVCSTRLPAGERTASAHHNRGSRSAGTWWRSAQWYWELVDPVDHATALTEQSYKAATGDPGHGGGRGRELPHRPGVRHAPRTAWGVRAWTG